MVTCPNAGCGRKFPDGRGLHAHKFHCKQAKGEQQGVMDTLPCDCKDGGDWEILTADVEGAGDYFGKINQETKKKYSTYCAQCKEVI
jgi:hypothetical protein